MPQDPLSSYPPPSLSLPHEFSPFLPPYSSLSVPVFRSVSPSSLSPAEAYCTRRTWVARESEREKERGRQPPPQTHAWARVHTHNTHHTWRWPEADRASTPSDRPRKAMVRGRTLCGGRSSGTSLLRFPSAADSTPAGTPRMGRCRGFGLRALGPDRGQGWRGAMGEGHDGFIITVKAVCRAKKDAG